MRRILWIGFSVLVTLHLVLFVVHFSKQEQKTLTVSFLNVGQGDAIFIQGPTGRQMLIDGGKDRSVLRELGRRMGPIDRTLDVVIATHPDADHIGGLSGVFNKYAVGTFISSGVPNDTTQAEALLFSVQNEFGLEERVAERGMRIVLGGGAYAEVLFPDREVSEVEPNTGSVILRVVYGNTSFMLSGDSPQSVENWLVALDTDALDADILKAGHHGSRTSTSDEFLSAVSPEVVVISAGKNNSYGHPHEEVLERIASFGARVVSTAESGTVIFVSDGTRIYQK